MSNDLILYKEKGLTEEESKTVQHWVESGRPGIANIKADHLFSIYSLGYTCQEIHSLFPEYPLAGILWARVKFDWDAKKTKDANVAGDMVMKATKLIGPQAIRHLLTIVEATHVKNERELLTFLAAPDREKPPPFLPQTLSQYSSLLQTLKELTTPVKSKEEEAAGNKPGLTAIIIQNNNGAPVQISTEERSAVVKEALKERVMAKRNGKPKNDK